MGDIATRTGFKKLGIEKVGALVTRGVMIDVAGYKGRRHAGRHLRDHGGGPRRPRSDVKNLTLQSGDAVIIHTGWGRLWDKDNARYNQIQPGIGIPAAQWLIAKEPMLLGADNTPVEVSPNPDKLLSTPIHQLTLVVNGVHLLEHIEARRTGRQETSMSSPS